MNSSFETKYDRRLRLARPIAKRRAGMLAGARTLAKDGILTFAYRSEFSVTPDLCATAAAICKQPMLHFPICLPPFFITITRATHHRHITRPSATMEISTCGARPRCVRQTRRPSDLPQAQLSRCLLRKYL